MFARVLVLCAALLGGTAASQLPEFAQQYRQRLGGAIDALEEVKADFQRDAAATGRSVSDALRHMEQSADKLVQLRSESLSYAFGRLDALKLQQAQMMEAASFERVVLFVRSPDGPIARATWADFEPAVPVTVEGGSLAVLGGGLGVFLVRLLGLAGRRRQRKKPVSTRIRGSDSLER